MRRGKTRRGQSQPDLTQEGDQPPVRLLWRFPRGRAFCFKFMYLAVLGLHCCAGVSLVAVLRLLFAVDSVAVEHGLVACGLQ